MHPPLRSTWRAGVDTMCAATAAGFHTAARWRCSSATAHRHRPHEPPALVSQRRQLDLQDRLAAARAPGENIDDEADAVDDPSAGERRGEVLGLDSGEPCVDKDAGEVAVGLERRGDGFDGALVEVSGGAGLGGGPGLRGRRPTERRRGSEAIPACCKRKKIGRG